VEGGEGGKGKGWAIEETEMGKRFEVKGRRRERDGKEEGTGRGMCMYVLREKHCFVQHTHVLFKTN
jgi:hypothetical protein